MTIYKPPGKNSWSLNFLRSAAAEKSAATSKDARVRDEWVRPDILLEGQAHDGECQMKKYVLAAVIVSAMAAPVFADEVGVGVRAGPVGGGVTIGDSHEFRDRDRDRTTIIKEREPRESDRTTVIKKQNEDGSREKTVIHHDYE